MNFEQDRLTGLKFGLEQGCGQAGREGAAAGDTRAGPVEWSA